MRTTPLPFTASQTTTQDVCRSAFTPTLTSREPSAISVVRKCDGTTQDKLGPGARIIVARQLWPQTALTGRVRSRLKPHFLGSNRQHSHEGEPREYNTDDFIHHRVAAEI
jgi:hypothetical protein